MVAEIAQTAGISIKGTKERTMRYPRGCLLSFMLVPFFAADAFAQDTTQELAKKLSNPIASLISVPFQFNYDSGYGRNDGEKAYVNIQPVIPFTLTPEWNMISRTIVPVVWQNDVAGPSGDQSGLGDITQSLFFSPSRPTESGIVWGVGPVLLLPTATDTLLGGETWGAGPTAVVLKQAHGWTVGALANHIWSLAGDDDRSDISATFLQPFVSYTNKDAWTFTLNTESTYDWEAKEWSVPVNFQVAKLFVVDKQPISLAAGVRYWAVSPDSGPQGWGVRTVVTLLFPK